MPTIIDGSASATFATPLPLGEGGTGSAVGALSGPNGSAFALRNALFNADFRINQRGYVSAATLAAGAYGHDRFKAGASGGDYSFTQLNSSTQVTIASGKSLIQVVEDKNVVGGSYVLSWTGTALARVGVNSATPSGTFVVSPLLITGQTAGTTMSVEFNAGTLNTAQLELGTVATPFERRPVGLELALCQRYFVKLGPSGAFADFCMLNWFSNIRAIGSFTVPVPMRISPVISFSGAVNLWFGENPQGQPTGTFLANGVGTPSGGYSLIGVDCVLSSAGAAVSGSCGQLKASNDANAFIALTAEL